MAFVLVPIDDAYNMGGVSGIFGETIVPGQGTGFHLGSTIAETDPSVSHSANGVSYYNLGAVYAVNFDPVLEPEPPFRPV